MRAAGRLNREDCVVSVNEGRVSFLAFGGGLGWKDVCPVIVTDRGEESFLQAGKPRACGSCLVASGTYPISGMEETIAMEVLQNRALVIRRKLRNPGPESVLVKGAALQTVNGRGRPVFRENSVWRARFAHLDNLRFEEYPWCRPEYPLVRPLPRSPTVFGSNEAQVVPALLFTNESYSEVLVEGQLSQEITRLRWRISASSSSDLFSLYMAEWEFPGSGGWTLQPGESIELEPLFWQILTDRHPQEAFSDYFRLAAELNRLCSEDNILLTRAFYCSWNYGIFSNISESSLLRTARFIRDNLPNVRHFLIDGGWQPHDPVHAPDCSNFYLPERKRYDRAKFPNGMKGMADRLRKIGLSPALWWTPSVSLTSRLAREKPHWLAHDSSGAPFRIGRSGCLDYSNPEVQGYLGHVFGTIFRKWGFEAMKMDFWSQSVESPSIRYSGGTGVMWRNWLLGTIRSHLPSHGFLMTCVATAMGNPFLGRHAHTYRACIDIGAYSRWLEHVYASCWVQGMLAIPGRKTCLINVDGLGVNPDLAERENIHRLTYGFITMGSIEVDGRLETLGRRHVGWLQKLTSDMDRGYPCLTADDQAFTGAPFPSALYVPYPEDSLTRRRGVVMHLALFNWSKEPRHIGVTREQVGLSGSLTAREFWTDSRKAVGSEGLCEIVEPHGARLYEISDRRC